MFKKLKTVTCLVLLSLTANSQVGSLVVISENAVPFYLTVNKRQINITKESIVKAFEIKEGCNYIAIKTSDNKINPMELSLKDSIVIASGAKFFNKEFTYSLIEQNGKLKLKFKSITELSGPETPFIPNAPASPIVITDNSVYGNLYRAKYNTPVFFNNYSAQTKNCEKSLNDTDVDYALDLFKKINDKEARVHYTNTIIDYNCYTTRQLKQLLEGLLLELDKFNYAKQAYRHVKDKEQMNTLTTLFTNTTMRTLYVNFLKEEELKLK